MDVISWSFALLTIASVLIYYIIPPKYRIGYLLLLSAAFIFSLSSLLLPYILIYALFNFYLGLKLPEARRKKTLFRLGLIINVSQLVLLRYASFAIDPIFRFLGQDILVSRLAEILIPVGISYFTLQGIGYLINVKMGWEKPEKDISAFFLYLLYFPKFISGPIERSNHFLPQLKEALKFDEERLFEGLRIALYGFFKKIVIADQLAPFIINSFSTLETPNASLRLLIIFLLPIYLYFDFSGYTDIAIGFSRMFGINLLPNFNRPFFSQNMTNFWKRFHISLSAWFGDYIFRQTVFKRRKWGVYASMYAVLITWVLFGIWHGGSWNFMFLGLLQAIAINYEFFTRKGRGKVFARIPGFPRIWLGRIFTYIFYGVSLVFFFSPDLKSTGLFFSGFSDFHALSPRDIISQIPLSAILLIIAIFIMELLQEDYHKTYKRLNSLWFGKRRVQVLFRWTVYSGALAMLFVLANKAEQFIYAQF